MQQQTTPIEQDAMRAASQALADFQAHAGASDPAAVLQALRAQRDELREQRNSLTEQRSEIVDQIQEQRSNGISITGLETRLGEVDKQISAIDQQIAISNANVARATAVPGSQPPDPAPIRTGPPQEVFIIPMLFIVFVFFPLAVAYARRIWKRTGSAVAAIPAEVMERLRAIEQSTEAIAVEVERIGEGQRFMSRLFSERGDARAIAEGAAQELAVRERVPKNSAR